MTIHLGKYWRLILLGLCVAGFLWVLYLMRTVALPFAIGLVLVYLLHPVVTWLEGRLPGIRRWPGVSRVTSIIIVFVLLIGIVGIFFYVLITVVIDTSVLLLESAPYFLSQSVYRATELLEVVRDQFPPEISYQIDQALIDASVSVGNMIRNILVEGISFVPRNIGIVLGFAALPFFLFYLLKDAELLRRGINSMLSPRVAEHGRNVVMIIEMVLGRYIRAQLSLGLIVAWAAFFGLVLMGIEYAPVLAVLAGITELIPTLGPWIGGGAAVIVTLALAPEKTLWVASLYLGIQMVENYFLVPRIQGGYLHLHPAVLIFLLVLGAYMAGFWGLLLIAPLTATLVEIFKYVRHQYLADTLVSAETGGTPA